MKKSRNRKKGSASFWRRRKSVRRAPPNKCQLGIEPLEDRRMLALIAPELHSRPGAPITLHLDFDGSPAFDFWTHPTTMTTTRAHGPLAGTNDALPAFTIDGNATDFSGDELDAIQRIWLQVSDKFSPFNVNVTTVPPPAYSNGVAVQILFSGTNHWWGSGGGIANRNAFTNAEVNSGFVFTAGEIDAGSIVLSDADRHFIAETAAHEAAHMFGLRHQSDYNATTNTVTVEYSNGPPTTAPIMGGSSLNLNKRGIWQIGDSSERNLAGQLVYTGSQNDFSLLQSALGPADDDVPAGSPSFLNISPDTGTILGAPRGVIEQSGDADRYAFTAATTAAQFIVYGGPYNPMLRPFVKVIDATNSAVVASVLGEDDAVSQAILTTNSLIPGRQYFLEISSSILPFYSVGRYEIYGNIGSVISQSGSVLNISGFAGVDDVVDVYKAAPDVIAVTYAAAGGSVTRQFSAPSISQINIFTLSGNDLVNIYADVAKPTTTNMGDDLNDRLQLWGTAVGDSIEISTGSVVINGVTCAFSNAEYARVDGQTGADTFTINGAHNVNDLRGGIGDDVFHIGAIGAGNLAAIPGDVTYRGDEGYDYFALHNDTATNNWFYTLTQTSITTLGPNGVTTHTLAAVEKVDIGGGYGSDFFNATAGNTLDMVFFGGGGDAADTAVLSGGKSYGFYGGDGDDSVHIGEGLLAGLPDFLVVDPGNGYDTFTLNNSASTSNDVWQYFGLGTAYPPQTVWFNTERYDTAGFETVRVLAGNGSTTIEAFGQLTQDLAVDMGGGADAMYFRNFDTWSYRNLGGTFIEDFHDVSIIGGNGFDALSVDDKGRVGSRYDYTLTANSIRGRNPSSLFLGEPLEHLEAEFSLFESLTVEANNLDNEFLVLGAPQLPGGQQTTLFLGGGNDDVTVRPRNAQGAATILSNVGILGGAGANTITYDDSTSATGAAWTINNPFGAATQNVSVAGGAVVGTTNQIQDIYLIGSQQNDSFNLESFKNGSRLHAEGRGGNDTFTLGANTKDLNGSVRPIGFFDFNGGDDQDTFNIANNGSTGRWVYTRDVGFVTTVHLDGDYTARFNSSAETVVVSSGGGDDEFWVFAAPAGSTTRFKGGNGQDTYMVNGGTTANAILGGVFLDGDAGNDTALVNDSGETAATTVHVEGGRVGARPGDNLFGPGGFLDFSDLEGELTVRLGASADAVDVTPHATTSLTIVGNAPTVAPGDVLRLALAGVANPVFTPNGAGAGTYAFSNAASVTYSGFESAAALIPGDFDGNGVVNGAELVRWRNGYGQAAGAGAGNGDADLDGDVDGGDFLVWQRQLGAGMAVAAAPLSQFDATAVAAAPSVIRVDAVVPTSPVLTVRSGQLATIAARFSHSGTPVAPAAQLRRPIGATDGVFAERDSIQTRRFAVAASASHLVDDAGGCLPNHDDEHRWAPSAGARQLAEDAIDAALTDQAWN